MAKIYRPSLRGILRETCNATNLVVFGYPTINFDSVDGPSEEFERLIRTADDEDTKEKVRHAAMHLDKVLAIFKIATAQRKIDAEHYMTFEDALASVEETLDEIDDLDRHTGYLHAYVEQILTDLLDTDDLLADAELEDYDGEDDFDILEDESLLDDLDELIGSDYDEDSEAEDAYHSDYLNRRKTD